MATQLAIAATPVSLSARPSRAEKQSGSASTGKQGNVVRLHRTILHGTSPRRVLAVPYFS